MSVQGYEELKNLNSKVDELIQHYYDLEQENKNFKTLRIKNMKYYFRSMKLK